METVQRTVGRYLRDVVATFAGDDARKRLHFSPVKALGKRQRGGEDGAAPARAEPPKSEGARRAPVRESSGRASRFAIEAGVVAATPAAPAAAKRRRVDGTRDDDDRLVRHRPNATPTAAPSGPHEPARDAPARSTQPSVGILKENTAANHRVAAPGVAGKRKRPTNDPPSEAYASRERDRNPAPSSDQRRPDIPSASQPDHHDSHYGGDDDDDEPARARRRVVSGNPRDAATSYALPVVPFRASRPAMPRHARRVRLGALHPRTGARALASTAASSSAAAARFRFFAAATTRVAPAPAELVDLPADPTPPAGVAAAAPGSTPALDFGGGLGDASATTAAPPPGGGSSLKDGGVGAGGGAGGLKRSKTRKGKGGDDEDSIFGNALKEFNGAGGAKKTETQTGKGTDASTTNASWSSSFSFGVAAPAEEKKSGDGAASAPAFTFGAASAETEKKPDGVSATGTSATAPAMAPATAPAAPAFTFGATPAAPAASSGPAFTFGAPTASASAAASSGSFQFGASPAPGGPSFTANAPPPGGGMSLGGGGGGAPSGRRTVRARRPARR